MRGFCHFAVLLSLMGVTTSWAQSNLGVPPPTPIRDTTGLLSTAPQDPPPPELEFSASLLPDRSSRDSAGPVEPFYNLLSAPEEPQAGAFIRVKSSSEDVGLMIYSRDLQIGFEVAQLWAGFKGIDREDNQAWVLQNKIIFTF